ncbi:MAG: 50S ribosomal protein L21 [Lachnospiraceae bacterium]|jgi:large subunit ribosomal protein L21|nr:50S ribosomal protein L21 [Lachnospiraceae bacterium]MBP5184856.1 50S ribosomal protein L21 [Lachnospiraceae bacterium]
MYAIIATGGKQYKVAEGDVLKVEKLGAEEGAQVTFDQVLAVNNDGIVLGNPTVAGASVSATVLENGKGKKVIVYRYKRKSGYHKKNGHRQQYTKVKIDKINA